MSLHRLVRHSLTAAGIPESALDARLIVEHRTGIDRAATIREPERPIPAEIVAAIDADLSRRVAGESVHRIVGWREFHGLRLRLSPGTLEPRDDTEALVELALPFVRERVEQTGSCRILDLGTGTGAVALALLAEVVQAVAVGTDIAEDALGTARENAAAHGLGSRFSTLRSNWFQNVGGRHDAIVSNPPYIRSAEIAGLAREVRDFDPRPALDGGTDGLDAYRAIAGAAAARLTPNGQVFVEIGFDQTEPVTMIFAKAGFAGRGLCRDLGGHGRALAFALA